MTLFQKIKRALWRTMYPVFPYIEKTFLFAHKKERQPFHIGWLRPDRTLAEMKKHLSQEYGFGNHFVAWEDSDQILSWRKLESFDFQYHLRVFSDGELRGHYEQTPESSPVGHFMESKEEARTGDFIYFLGEYVTSIEPKTKRVLVKGPNSVDAREPEIEFKG